MIMAMLYKYKQYVAVFTKGPAFYKRTTLGDTLTTAQVR